MRNTANWLKPMCLKVIESRFFVAASYLATIYCLFGQDVRTICFDESATGIFDFFTISSLIFFTVEILFSCVGIDGYLNSFFFYLDVIATSTLILDISKVSASVVASTVSNASSASRAATQAKRVIRLISLIRLFRISKVVRAFWVNKRSFRKKKDGLDEEDSDVGEKLSRLSIQRVVIIILLLVLVTPQLRTSAQFVTAVDLYTVGLEKVHRAYSMFLETCMQGTIEPMTKARALYEYQVVSLLTNGCNVIINDCPKDKKTRLAWIGGENLKSIPACTGPSLTLNISASPLTERLGQAWTDECDSTFSNSFGVLLSNKCPSDRVVFTSKRSSSDDSFTFQLVLDMSAVSKSDALLSIYRTISILVVLAVGTYTFSQGAFVLVLEPVRQMMEKVDKIRKNPLLAASIDDQSHKRTEFERLKRLAEYNTATNVFSKWIARRRLAELNPASLETSMLEKTIVRIGGLLALGFGPAGAEIVAHNMNRAANGINAMVPGKRVDAIFAFIRIADFSILTSVLQDKIMLFANQICDIVHGIADEFHGSANRSNGDSFLMIWRLSDLSPEKISQMHDMAAAACAKILIAIRRSIELHDYSLHPPLMQQIPEYQVNLSFGLHRGWAIEGAIGSNLKIDPSYIGPDVNLAEMLDEMNQEYGTTICLSERLVSGCTPGMSAMFRQIGRVGVVESGREIINVYSFDLDRGAKLLTQYEIENLVLTQPTPRIVGDGISRHRQRAERDKRKGQKWETDIPSYLRRDKYFALLRELYERDPLFFQKFKNGWLNLECGEWDIAKTAFEETRQMLGRKVLDDSNPDELSIVSCTDGPSEALLRYMSSNVQ